MVKRKKKKNKILFILLLLVLIGGASYYLMTNGTSFESFAPFINKVKNTLKEKKVSIIDIDSNTRPYAVMINNVNAAWPYQAGLCDAYIEYTLLVEGGLTRKMALFKDVSDDIKIMSIRSSRHYFIDYALENDAIYTHWGWSPYAQSDIKTFKVNNINGLYYENVYFERDKEVRKKVSSEHTGFITTGNIKKASEKLGYRMTTDNKSLLKYSVDSIDASKYENVVDADKVEIRYSGYYTSKYDYDVKTKKYTKMQNNTEMKDYNDTCELMYKNIITYQIPYANISGDAKGRLNATTTGSGTGYYITEGKAIPITWEKKERSSKTIYKYANGDELVVNDGNTAIEIQPKNQSLKITKIEREEE